ncbi:MAG: presqualene diphosphate synthase HpnD [Candidatus Binatia bacterium]|nr:presqualene diphosphate synthase HpnD [Candidatus Binatia bacterium]
MTAPTLASVAHGFSLAPRRSLQDDLARCRAIVEGSGSSFHFAFYLLPQAKRDALCAVYAFCRAADDIADAAGVSAPADRLEAWGREVERAFAGRPVHSIGRALSWAIDSFALPRKPFFDLIDGVASDLTTDRYETAEQLEGYCYHVASTVGLLCVRIFGAGRGVADDYAVSLGKAFQITNILRDVGEDAERGRIYLPLEDLASVGCQPETLLERRALPEVGRLVALEVSRARALYAQAGAALPEDPVLRRDLAPAEAMHRIYASLLDRVEETGARVVDTRARVPSSSRAWLAMRAWAGGVRAA